jgi:Ser/Thr protein kinase RdoA (MazF antagonist)
MAQEPINHLLHARQALAEYSVKDPHLAFIRQSDTISYKVEAPAGNTYLLRLHTPLNQAIGTHGADTSAVNSEILWREALCRDTDLVLQQPIRNKNNAFVTSIEVPGGGELVNCTLLRWVAGESYSRDLETEDTAFQIGKITATLHNHANQWDIPGGFNRPKRDTAYFEKVLRGILPAVMDGRISQADYKVLDTSVNLLIDQIRGLSKDPQVYGIIHADMHKGNMLIAQGQIRLIDFSFCAFSNYMFDPAICLADMKQELHQAFQKGYQSLRSFPDGYQRLVEGLFIGSMVGTFSYWVPNPQAAAILARKVPQVTQAYAIKYNRGEPFWYEV